MAADLVPSGAGSAGVRKEASGWRGLWQARGMATGAVEKSREDDGKPGGRPGLGRLRYALLVLAGWSVVALAFAAQGWWAAQQRGAPQPWWPSLGYSAAIFSVWALLTGPIGGLVGRTERSGLSPWRRLALYAAGFPIVTACHVGLFAVLYWPLYNDDGRIASPLAMAWRMLLPNVHTNVVFYAGLVAIAVGLARARQRQAGDWAPQGDRPANVGPERLRIRSRGRVRDLAYDEIDWIGAAGNYAEIHGGGGAHLIEESLAALAGRLPEGLFARIHRQTIVRLALIREIRGQGRGDGLVRLADGTELRLSRRYRAAVAVWLQQG